MLVRFMSLKVGECFSTKVYDYVKIQPCSPLTKNGKVVNSMVNAVVIKGNHIGDLNWFHDYSSIEPLGE
jgi:hypothetical protein